MAKRRDSMNRKLKEQQSLKQQEPQSEKPNEAQDRSEQQLPKFSRAFES